MTLSTIFSTARNVVRRPFFWGLILMLALAGCSTPAPTSTVEGENEAVAQSTPGEENEIYLPLFQKGGQQVPLPTGAPLTEWPVAGGVVPVMAGAQAGDEVDGKYVFTTPAALADVEAYYLQEMPARGWTSLSIGESMDIKDLLFQLGDSRLNIHIEFLPDQNLTYVVIEG
ncbi:MAG TPA: hypothetical protein PK530_07875 [Anaerolineales bacterium]|nr:hypothetical protein [Anaerolineales bacterium]